MVTINCCFVYRPNEDSTSNYCSVWTTYPKRGRKPGTLNVNGVLMKLFRSSNIEIIAECRNHFGVELPSVQLAKRFKKFSDKICIMIA